MKIFKFFPVLLVLLIAGFSYINTLDFQYQDINGQEHKLSDYKGKWVVVNYWATWCPPCEQEIPELVNFQNTHRENDTMVLGVNVNADALETVKAFSEEYRINYPVLLSDNGKSSQLGKIIGLPTTFIVSPEGDVVAKKVGQVSQSQLESLIEFHKKRQYRI